jgi:hypothetical protein
LSPSDQRDTHGEQAQELADLRLAHAALTKLVMAEYPENYSLAEIGYTWGEGLPPEEIAALKRLERR